MDLHALHKLALCGHGPLQAHVDFFLRNPMHISFAKGGLYVVCIGETPLLVVRVVPTSQEQPPCVHSIRDHPVPYSLRFPEDFVACSLVTQAVIGHEDRLVFGCGS